MANLQYLPESPVERYVLVQKDIIYATFRAVFHKDGTLRDLDTCPDELGQVRMLHDSVGSEN